MYELKSVSLVQRAYRSKYKNKKCPTKATILNLSWKFDRTGSLLDLPPKPKNERETRIRLKILFNEDPSLSMRKASVDVGISYSLCRDILLKDLRLKPYKYQRLRKKGYFRAQWWLGLAKSTYKWLIASDVAYFYLTEAINKQNNRMWLEEKPLDWIEKPLHDEKVLVWCGISCRKVYGPYFFEKTVNQHNNQHTWKCFKTFSGLSIRAESRVTKNITFNRMALLRIPQI